MREIFKHKKGKDFYRDQLEYLEYDQGIFDNYEEDYTLPDDEEIGYYVACKIAKLAK